MCVRVSASPGPKGGIPVLWTMREASLPGRVAATGIRGAGESERPHGGREDGELGFRPGELTHTGRAAGKEVRNTGLRENSNSGVKIQLVISE